MNSGISASIALGVMLTAGAVWAHHNMSALFDFNQRFTDWHAYQNRLEKSTDQFVGGREERRGPGGDLVVRGTGAQRFPKAERQEE
jgi:hypothetical protein